MIGIESERDSRQPHAKPDRQTAKRISVNLAGSKSRTTERLGEKSYDGVETLVGKLESVVK